MDIASISKLIVSTAETKQEQSCPRATSDIAVNLKNRQKAIDTAGYGPLNPKETNADFWSAKAERWDVSSSDAKKQLCGNCAAFIKTEKMLECINSGLSAGGENDAWDVINAGELGYCEAFDFKCAASRTCDAWIVGGPITQETPEAPEAEERPEDMSTKSADETNLDSYLESLSDDELDILFPENEEISDYEAKWLFDVAGAYFRRALTNRRGRRRRRKSDHGQIGEKGGDKPVLRDPDGGLTAAGRKYFKEKEGANLKPGVKGPADTPTKMRRKGSFLVRFFSNPRGPLVDKNGKPTRLALSARAWGEPAPTSVEAAKKLAAKGRSLLDRYRKYQESQKKSLDDGTEQKALGQTLGQRQGTTGSQQQGGTTAQGSRGGGGKRGNYDPNARDADGDGTVQEGTDYARQVEDDKKKRRSGSADTRERRVEADERKRTGRGQGYDELNTPEEVAAYYESEKRRQAGTTSQNQRRNIPAPSTPVERGNIDLAKRKPVELPDGELATVRSASVNIEGEEVLLPTIGPNGENWDPDTEEGLNAAIDHYERTGEHLGKFSTPEEASAYGEWLHEREAERIGSVQPRAASSGSADRMEREGIASYLEEQGFDKEAAKALGKLMHEQIKTFKPGQKTNWLPGRLPNGGRIAENGTYIPPDMVRRDDKTQSDYYRNRRNETPSGTRRTGTADNAERAAQSQTAQPKRGPSSIGSGVPQTPWSNKPQAPGNGKPQTPWSTEPQSPRGEGEAPRKPNTQVRPAASQDDKPEPKKPSDGKPKYGSNVKPYGSNVKPYGSNVKPYGSGTKPYGSNTKPYGSNAKPWNSKP